METTPLSNQLTVSDVSHILGVLGYRQSNQAQVYYSTDFKLPVLDENYGYQLAKRIKKYYVENTDGNY